jgi:alkylation response protein AidB-like acyl-CoA dehydrogenase
MLLNAQPQPLETHGQPRIALPEEPAHILGSDAEPIGIAHRLAAEFAQGAAERDRDRRLPFAEIAAFSQSGLWSLNVPKAYGGPAPPTPPSPRCSPSSPPPTRASARSHRAI